MIKDTSLTQVTGLKVKVALGIGAHPDDLDFMASGSMAKLVAEGADVYYVIITDGSKGSDDTSMSPMQLIELRQAEQRAACKLLGIKDVFFLGYEDGMLEVTMQLKRDIVRQLRLLKPDVVFAMDPSMLYNAEHGFINHPDHRAGGQAVMDAVFPLARDYLSFPELYKQENLQPHKVSTLLLTNFSEQNFYIDVTDTLPLKLQALKAHASQMPDFAQAQNRITDLAIEAGKQMGVQYAEGFLRLDIH